MKKSTFKPSHRVRQRTPHQRPSSVIKVSLTIIGFGMAVFIGCQSEKPRGHNKIASTTSNISIDPALERRILASIKKLDAEEWTNRENGVKELVAIGEVARSYVERENRQTDDAEVKARINQVLQGLDARKCGRIAFLRNGNWEGGNLWVINADGNNLMQLTDTEKDRDVAWSPDCTTIAFTSKRGGTFEIYTMDSDGRNQTRLTKDGAWNQHPTWSPQGNKIAYISQARGWDEMFLVDADGKNQVKIVEDSSLSAPVWSPDGKKILVIGYRHLFIADLDTTNVMKSNLEKGIWMSPSWSPDGRKIAVSSYNGVCTKDADGGNFQEIMHENNGSFDFLSWSPDGAKLAFGAYYATGGRGIWITDPDGGEQKRLTQTMSNDKHISWTPDGRNIVFERSETICVMGMGNSDVQTITEGRAPAVSR